MPTLVNQENRSSKRSQLSPTLKTLLALLILLVPVLILLGKALFTGKMLNAGDYINQYYPWRHYAATSILRGTFPLWNPYAACGYPFFADAQTAMLYPLNFVYLIFPIGRAILYSVMLHLFLGGAFMYVLVLRLTKGNRLAAIIGALAYMLNGYNSADLEGHVALLNVTCWLPLIFLLHYAAAERMSWKYAAAAGTVMGVTLLAGHLNMFFYIGLAVVFLYIWKGCTAIIHRDPLRLLGLFGLFAMAVLISACLSAPQLLPAFQFAEHSIRYTQWSFRDAVYCSFPIHGFLTFIAPGLFGTSQTYWGSTGNYIETSAYPGIFPLILAAAAVFGRKTKERWYFVALALIGLFLALGGYNPAYRFLCDHLPLLGRFRAPARALLLCSFSLSVLAGLGADKLLSHSLSLKRYAKALIITLLAVYISLIAAVPLTLRYRHQLQSLAHDVIDFEFFELRQMFHPLQYYYNRIDVSTMTTALHRPLIVLPVFIALAILLWRKKINSTVFCILLTLVGIINLVSFGDRFVETTRPEKHFAETKAIRYLKDDRAVYRIATVTGMDRNHGMVHAIQDTQINNPLRLKRYEQIFGLIKSSPDTTDTRKRTMSETALNLLNVKYLMVKNEIENKQFELVKEFTKPGK